MNFNQYFIRRAGAGAILLGVVTVLITQAVSWYGIGSVGIILAGCIAGAVLGTVYHAIRHRLSVRGRIGRHAHSRRNQ